VGCILLADAVGLAAPAQAAAAQLGGMPPVVAVADGALAVGRFVEAARGGTPPALVVVDDALPRVGGRGVVRAIRAVERGLGLAPTAVLLYSAAPADEDIRLFLREVGRAVHLQRPAEHPLAEQARRFALASQRLLAQLQPREAAP
jgi:CheY-like chemotaxis protein